MRLIPISLLLLCLVGCNRRDTRNSNGEWPQEVATSVDLSEPRQQRHATKGPPASAAHELRQPLYRLILIAKRPIQLRLIRSLGHRANVSAGLALKIRHHVPA